MIQMELYKRGAGTLKKFNPVRTTTEAKEFIDSYCKENNVTVVAREWFDNAMWNYLSDGTEIDYYEE